MLCIPDDYFRSWWQLRWVAPPRSLNSWFYRLFLIMIGFLSEFKALSRDFHHLSIQFIEMMESFSLREAEEFCTTLGSSLLRDSGELNSGIYSHYSCHFPGDHLVPGDGQLIIKPESHQLTIESTFYFSGTRHHFGTSYLYFKNRNEVKDRNLIRQIGFELLLKYPVNMVIKKETIDRNLFIVKKTNRHFKVPNKYLLYDLYWDETHSVWYADIKGYAFLKKKQRIPLIQNGAYA